MTMLTDGMLTKIRRVSRRFPEIEAVYLFGSAAEGRAHVGSDLDLAVVPGNAALREKKLDLLAELARKGICNVDLVFLDESDLVLAYEAVRLNRLIYAGDGFDRGAFYSKIVRMYLDFEPYLRRQRGAYRRRVIGATA